MTIYRGHEVLVKKKSRAKGSPPVGTVAIIVGLKNTDWGVTFYLKDKNGMFYRCPESAFEITTDTPDWSPPETLIPVIVVPRDAKNWRGQSKGWCYFNIVGLGSSEARVWISDLYINGRKCKMWDKYKESITFVDSTDDDPGFKITPDQSFTAEMPDWKYAKYAKNETPGPS